MDATDSGRDPVEELAEEFIERRRRGEMPTFEEYARTRLWSCPLARAS
jgi:hypothetical protein